MSNTQKAGRISNNLKAKINFHIAGIGASAGGFEALEQFFQNMPVDSGIGFVVIQHLDPKSKGMMPELLRRITKMKVVEVKESMPVEPNVLYTIPPNTVMSVMNGILHLFEPPADSGVRYPIDTFFASLAKDNGCNCSGTILSGMGDDGVKGVAEIQKSGGYVLVQDPASAKYDAMPSNTIETLEPDVVDIPAALPAKLLELLKKNTRRQKLLSIDKSSFQKILLLLRSSTGTDFSGYKKNTLYRRIERRMSVHQITKVQQYIKFLMENNTETEILFKEILIGVTSFFRDSATWEHLRDRILPEILSTSSTPDVIRVWIPACSTGEEAYSLAIIFKEAVEKIRPDRHFILQIFATDLDSDSIDHARKGTFPLTIAETVSQVRLDRFFIRENSGYRVRPEIREMIIFAVQNVISNPPFTKIDLLLCRNFLIYIEPELQKKLLHLFHYSLQPGGILLLGNAESIGNCHNLFDTLEPRFRLFIKKGITQPAEVLEIPAGITSKKTGQNKTGSSAVQTDNFQSVVEQLLLKEFAPLGLLLNQSGDILYISGRSGQFLEPPTGKVNWNIFAMLHERLRSDFSILFRRALQSGNKETALDIRFQNDGVNRSVDMIIQLLQKPEQLFGLVLVVLSSKIVPIEIQTNISVQDKENILEYELQKARENLQSLQEEMQTSQEELKSSNEELQSTNEELQSTNEELTTSKEEMQSLNEELQSVNLELQMKVDEYSRINNDMENLLNSTEIATIFLDKNLNIRRFTQQATKIAKLIQSDIGRPFTDLTSEINYPELAHDAREVLRSLIFIEKPVASLDGRWFNVRIIPYRTFDDRIDGLVITFTDITNIMLLKEGFRETSQVLGNLIKFSKSVAFAISPAGKILEFNEAAEKLFGKSRTEVIDRNYFEMFVPDDLRSAAKIEMLSKFAEKNPVSLTNFVTGKNGENIRVEWLFSKMYDEDGRVSGLIATGVNISS